MAVIFWFSSQPNTKLPDFNLWDKVIKKAGHVTGYALLGVSYWYGLGLKKEKRWLAWLLVLLYACTDEYHQSFVLGRHPSVWDVLIFDNAGALIGIWLAGKWSNKK